MYTTRPKLSELVLAVVVWEEQWRALSIPTSWFCEKTSHGHHQSSFKKNTASSLCWNHEMKKKSIKRFRTEEDVIFSLSVKILFFFFQEVETKIILTFRTQVKWLYLQNYAFQTLANLCLVNDFSKQLFILNHILAVSEMYTN